MGQPAPVKTSQTIMVQDMVRLLPRVNTFTFIDFYFMLQALAAGCLSDLRVIGLSQYAFSDLVELI